MVKESFPQHIVECEVFKGDPSFDLWRETYLHGVDLFIAGSKHHTKGRGILPKHFARKSFCSTLFIPEDAQIQLNKIFLPIDFSDYSKDALRLAAQLAKSNEGSEIICQNVYELPYAYSLTDSPRQRYVEIMEKNTNERFDEFIDGVSLDDIDISGIFQVRDYPYVAEHIKNEAEAQNADIIMMAAGGRSKLSRIFLGSETEKMVEMEKNIPLLILKKKVRKVNLWDIFTSIN
jgi:nucleotide-binding universal stress UspA family protein